MVCHRVYDNSIEASHPVSWECGVAFGLATSTTWDGLNQTLPLPVEQNIATNPATSVDYGPTVHTCESSLEISGATAVPRLICARGDEDGTIGRVTTVSTRQPGSASMPTTDRSTLRNVFPIVEVNSRVSDPSLVVQPTLCKASRFVRPIPARQ